MRFLLPPLIALCVASSATAQEPRFATGARLVMLPVTVTDAKGREVDELGASDFVVLDNGRPQKATVDTIGTGVAPISLVVAVQASGISAAVLEKVRKVGSLIQPLLVGERGCAGLLSFADKVTWMQECTQDPDALRQAFLRLRGGSDHQGRMLDAARAAIGRLSERPNTRRVLLLISESKDRGSEDSLGAVVAAAQNAGVVVYSATYSAFRTGFTSRTAPQREKRSTDLPVPNVWGTIDGQPPSPANPRIISMDQSVDAIAGLGELRRMGEPNTAKVLAAGTGGEVFPFARQKGLEEAIGKLGRELSGQYVLSFTPEAGTAGYHSLTVRLTRGGEFHIRARPGYWHTGGRP